jgi:hypothetical protein
VLLQARTTARGLLCRSMTRFRLAFAVVVSAVCASCAGDTSSAAGEGEGEGEGATADVCKPVLPARTCTMPTAVDCRDQTLVALSMTAEDTTPGLIDSATVDGGFHTTVDATAGGFGGGLGFVYGKFTDAGLQKVELTDDASFESMDWDISFRRFVVRLNSGSGGPSCVSAARTGPATDYDCPTLDAAGVDQLDFNEELFMSAGTCDLIPDGSGLPGAAGVALQGFWTYPGCVQMSGNVYMLSLADGRHVKLRFTDYYFDDVQQQCQDTDMVGMSSTGSGTLQLDWAYLD